MSISRLVCLVATIVSNKTTAILLCDNFHLKLLSKTASLCQRTRCILFHQSQWSIAAGLVPGRCRPASISPILGEHLKVCCSSWLDLHSVKRVPSAGMMGSGKGNDHVITWSAWVQSRSNNYKLTRVASSSTNCSVVFPHLLNGFHSHCFVSVGIHYRFLWHSKAKCSW